MGSYSFLVCSRRVLKYVKEFGFMTGGERERGAVERDAFELERPDAMY